MPKKDGKSVYIDMMLDSLRKKRSVLSEIDKITVRQEKLLQADEFDIDAFGRALDDKGIKISEIEELDSGFDRIFGRVEQELKSAKELYSEEIRLMQEELKAITDLSTRIQTAEKRNDERFRKYMTEQKDMVKKANEKQRTLNSYTRSMSGTTSQTNSYYFNETK